MAPTSPHRAHHKHLHGVLDDLLDADVHEWSDADVHELVLSLTRAQNRLDASLSSAVQAWDSRQVWADDGSRAQRSSPLPGPQPSPRAPHRAPEPRHPTHRPPAPWLPSRRPSGIGAR